MRKIYRDNPLSCALYTPGLCMAGVFAIDGPTAVRTNPKLLELMATVSAK
jgi:hypothetical protein